MIVIGLYDFDSNSIMINGNITKGMLFNYSFGDYYMFIDYTKNDILKGEFVSHLGHQYTLPILFDKNGKHINHFPLKTTRSEKSINLMLI